MWSTLRARSWFGGSAWSTCCPQSQQWVSVAKTAARARRHGRPLRLGVLMRSTRWGASRLAHWRDCSSIVGGCGGYLLRVVSFGPCDICPPRLGVGEHVRDHVLVAREVLAEYPPSLGGQLLCAVAFLPCQAWPHAAALRAPNARAAVVATVGVAAQVVQFWSVVLHVVFSFRVGCGGCGFHRPCIRVRRVCAGVASNTAGKAAGNRRRRWWLSLIHI